MRYRLTIPNDYASEVDTAMLERWCAARGIQDTGPWDPMDADEVFGGQYDCEAIFEAALDAWPEALLVSAPDDWSQLVEAPAPPPEDSDDWPPLWVEKA